MFIVLENTKGKGSIENCTKEAPKYVKEEAKPIAAGKHVPVGI